MSAELDEAVLKHFEKRFELSESKPGQRLPGTEKWCCCPKWSEPELLLLHQQLTEVKNQLNDKPLNQWHQHTRLRNPAGSVISYIKSSTKSLPPELVTQAWCKFTECLNQFSLVEEFAASSMGTEVFRTAHLCEAPGAFISALNHFLKTHYPPLRWDWMASTLNPYCESNRTALMINDDRFIKYTLDKWHFGRDNTGNILNHHNMADLIASLTNSQTRYLHLITADGSVDCQSDPAKQESMVSELHWAEIVVALSCLAKGGHLVLKMFTFFECDSICMLFLLTRLFGQVFAFKPATSREGNSEVYVICKNFDKAAWTDDMRDKLIHHRKPNTAVFRLEDVQAASPFLDQVVRCATFFKQCQCEAILSNVSSFLPPEHGPIQAPKQIQILKREVANHFISRYHIQTLPSRFDRLLPDVKYSSAQYCLHLNIRAETERSFSDKIRQTAIDKASLRQKLLDLRPWWLNNSKLIEWADSYSDIEYLEIIYGSPINQINSSKFCPSDIIEAFGNILKYVTAETDSSLVPPNILTSWPSYYRLQPVDGPQPEQVPSNPNMTTTFNSLIAEVCELLQVDSQLLDEHSGGDLPHLLGNVGDHYALLDFIKELESALALLTVGQHLLITEFVPLTRVRVALLLLLSRSFDKIGFVRPCKLNNALLLYGFRGEQHSSFSTLSNLRMELQQVRRRDDRHPVQLLPIANMTQEPLYSYILAHNVNVLLEKGQALLDAAYKCA